MPAGQLAMMAAQAGGGVAMGLFNDWRQREQQRKLNAMQLDNQRMMLHYQNEAAYDMWQRTNYSAQVEQLKKAGLNPGLLYGMGGGGGATTGGASGGFSAPHAERGQELAQAMAIGLQQQLTQAQVENIKADTKKKLVEAEKTEGVDTEEAKKRIESLTQGITESGARTAMLKIESMIKDLELKLQGETFEARADYIEYMAGKMFRELQIADDAQYVSHATRLTRVDIVRQELIGAQLRNALTEAQTRATEKGIEVSDMQINQMAHSILQRWKEISQGDTKLEQGAQQLAIEAFKAEIQAAYPGLWNAFGRMFDEGIGALYDKLRLERTKYNKVQK